MKKLIPVLIVLLIGLCGCSGDTNKAETEPTTETVEQEVVTTTKYVAIGEMSFAIEGLDFEEEDRTEEITDVCYSFTSVDTGKDVIVTMGGYSGDRPDLESAAAQLEGVSTSATEETTINITNYKEVEAYVVKDYTHDTDNNVMYTEDYYFECADLYWIYVQAYEQEDIDNVMHQINMTLKTHNDAYTLGERASQSLE